MNQKLTEVLWISLVVAVLSLPFFYVYAKVSSCGWRGLFVECRIMDCPK